ncbi:protein transport protein S31 [Binucleata daphniae]
MILPNRFLTSFNPNKTHIALATKAKLFDPTFTTTSSLFIYDYKAKKYICEYKAPTRYNTLEYINETVLVGGMEDGTIEMYSIDVDESKSEINSENNNSENRCEDAEYTINLVFSNNTLLSGDILSFSYNATKSMLAISSQNKKFILLNTQTYKAFSPGLAIYEDLVALKWNPKVSHILAALNTKNVILVFDLKTKREVIRTKKDIGECKKIWWSEEKTTCLYVFGDKGTYLYDLSCDKIERVCEGGISIYNKKKIDTTNNINADGSDYNISSFIVCGDTFVSYNNSKFNIDSIFDAQFKNDFVCLSYFDKTEIIKIADLFKKNGFLYGKRKVLLSGGKNGVYVYTDKIEEYKMKVDGTRMHDEDLVDSLCNLYNNKNVIEFFMQFYDKKENEDFCIKKDSFFVDGEMVSKNKKKTEVCEGRYSMTDDNKVGDDKKVEDEERSSVSKADNKIKICDDCSSDEVNNDNSEINNLFYDVTVPFSIFSKLNTKNFSDIEYNKISDKKVVFLLSQFCNNYDYLVQNINLNDFYILFVFLYKQSNNMTNESVINAIEDLAKRMYNTKKRESSFIYLVLKNIKRFYEIQTEIIGNVKIENYLRKKREFENVVEVIKKISKDENAKEDGFEFECGMYNEFYSEETKSYIKNIVNNEIVGNNKYTKNDYANKRSTNFDNANNRNIDQKRVSNYLKNNNTQVTNTVNDASKRTSTESIYSRNNMQSRVIPTINSSISGNINSNENVVSEHLGNMSISKPKKTYGMRNSTVNQNFEVPKQSVQERVNSSNIIPGFDKQNNTFIPGVSKPSNTFVPNKPTVNNTFVPNKPTVNNTFVPNKPTVNNTFVPNKPYSNTTAPSSNIVTNSNTNENKPKTKPIVPQAMPQTPMSMPKAINTPAMPMPQTIMPKTTMPMPKVNANSAANVKTSNTPQHVSSTYAAYTSSTNTSPYNASTPSTPASAQNNILTETEKQEILDSFVTKIKYLQEVCSAKKGVLIKNKINTANKRLEYFKAEMGCELLKELECLFNLIDIEELKHGNLTEVKNRIYDNFRMICEDVCKKYESETSVWLPGVVGLLQVVLSDSK